MKLFTVIAIEISKTASFITTQSLGSFKTHADAKHRLESKANYEVKHGDDWVYGPGSNENREVLVNAAGRKLILDIVDSNNAI